MESSRAWTCAACKRLVPGNVAVCRCRESRPAFVYEPGEFEPERPPSPWAATVGLTVVAVVTGVYPGEVRDLRRKFRLEWDAWEK